MIDTNKMDRKASGGAGTEGGRRPTGVPAPPHDPAIALADVGRTPNGDTKHPNPQVVEKPLRRRFAKTYKLDILRQADECVDTGQIGALLRREGLYASNLSNWRWQRSQGLLEEKSSGKRTAKSSTQDPRVQQLQRENVRLTARLKQAEFILEIQKKVSEILGIPLKMLDNEGND
jgi:transposase-like protein